MNVIVLMLDSLRQDHVSAYGWDHCPLKTPGIDALASEAITFDNCYPEGLPTIPVRTDLITGMSSLTNRPWQPLTETDVSGAEIFRKEGYQTAMVADTYHLFKPDMNFHRGFDIFHWIRGAEYDSCKAGPLSELKLEDHINDRIPEAWRKPVTAALRNLEGRSEPEDFPCWQTMEQGLRILEDARNADRPLFLWIDTFQPHEPWSPPARFDTFGDPGYTGPKIVLPPGGPAETWASPEEIARIQSLYAGDAAYTDYCVGHFLEGARQLGYLDDSVIVALSDHGHPLCDHGKFLKGPDRLYSELLKVPFIVRLPEGRKGGRRVTDMARFPDLMPTLLDLAGIGVSGRAMAGISLVPVIDGNGASTYKATVSGFFGSSRGKSNDRCIRNRDHSLIWRPDLRHELYDLKADPREMNNIIEQKPDIARNLVEEIGAVYFDAETKQTGLQGLFEVAHTSLG